MSTKIEFHVIQSFPPANLNRDDTNMPKDCEFGGVRRARISSQCIKRAIRLHPDFAKYTEVLPGERTKLMSVFIAYQLISAGKAEDEAKTVAQAFTDTLLGAMDKKSPQRSSVLFYVSGEEKETIVKSLLQGWDQAIEGTFELLPPGGGLKIKRIVGINIGKPLYFKREFKKTKKIDKDSEEYKQVLTGITDKVMGKIASLKAEIDIEAK